jgi:hypothetical protein
VLFEVKQNIRQKSPQANLDAADTIEKNNRSAAKVLLFNLSEATDLGRDVRNIIGSMNIRVITVSREQLNEKVGYLAGLEDFSSVNESFTGSGYDEELMLMCRLSDGQIDGLLEALRKNGVSLKYKAVMTESNCDWVFKELLTEIKAEHELMEAIISLDRLVKTAAKLQTNNYSAAAWLPFQISFDNAIFLLQQEDPASAADYLAAAARLTAEMDKLSGE